MHPLIGEYEVNIDAKGRLMLPAGFRKQLSDEQGNRFVLNRGFEHCITLYPMESWERISRDLDRLNYANAKAREYKRLFLNGANMVDVDAAGRLLLPKSLLNYAGITKEMVFSAQGDRAELWDAKAYYTYINERMDGFGDLAAEVAGGDFFNP